MGNQQMLRKQYLIQLLKNISDIEIANIIYEETASLKQISYTSSEIEQAILKKYQQVLSRDSIIVKEVLRFKSVHIRIKTTNDGCFLTDESTDKDEQYYNNYADHLLTWGHCNEFTVIDGKIIDPKGILIEIREVYTANQIIDNLLFEKEQRKSLLLLNPQATKPKVSTKIATKSEILREHIEPYGFLALPKVKSLSIASQAELIELIAIHKTPYDIAMFDFLDFIKHLKTNHTKTNTDLQQELAKWFEVGAREIKGNINVLNERSTEDRSRYTACQHKEQVKIDFEKLK